MRRFDRDVLFGSHGDGDDGVRAAVMDIDGRPATLLHTVLSRPLLLDLAIVAGLVPAAAIPARAETPLQHCRRVGVDDTLRPLPASLVPAAQRLFGLRMPAEQVQHTTYFRCANGRILVCNVGANLPCGKADTSRNSPGATAYCRENPGSDVVPKAATGHDTIFRWRCVGRAAQPSGPVEKVDSRGFFRRYWKVLK